VIQDPQRLLRFVLCGALLIVLASHLVDLFDLTRKNYGEGVLQAVIDRMRREPISLSWMSGPEITLTNYGPGYPWAVLGLSSLTPWKPTLLPGRLVSFAAVLATAALIGALVRRRTASLELGLLSSLLFLASSYVSTWAPRQRADGLALLFSMAAYLTVDLGRRGLLASALLIATGSLVKQPVALTGLIIGAHLLMGRRLKETVIYAAVTGGLGGILWTVVNWTSGGYYFANAIAGNLMPMSYRMGLSFSHLFLLYPLGLAACIVIAVRFVEDSARVLRCVYCLAFVMNLGMTTLLASKIGSDTNYYIEASALAAVVVGVYGFSALWEMHRARAAVVMVMVVLAFTLPIIRHMVAQPERWRHLSLEGPDLTELAEPANSARFVLADGEQIDLVLQAGYRPVVNDPLQFWLLAERGTGQLDDLLTAMNRGEVPYLVLTHPIRWHRENLEFDEFWPVVILDAMERHYRLISTREDRFVYAYTDDPGT
jgi:hypothetical protein